MKASPASPAWWRAALIVMAVGFVFGPCVRGGWLWDDNQEVTENAVLRDPAGLAKIWSGSAGADYFPLKTTVQWIEWRLWSDRPAGYHALSVLLHLANALLFWRLLSRLGLRWAWIGGLLFAVHPLTVESVAWAAELKNTLSLPLLLGAMLAWLRFDEHLIPEGRDGRPARPQQTLGNGGANGRAGRPSLPWHVLSLGLFTLAMLAKSSVVMFPAVILLHAWWRRGRVGKADWLAAAPFAAVSLVLGLVTVWFQHHRAMQPDLVVAGGLPSRAAGAGLAIAFYLLKSVLPVGLMPIYPRWQLDPPTLADWVPWLGTAGIALSLWSVRRGWGRAALFGLGFFALNLLPVSGFITTTYMRLTWVADHFAYLALLGVIGLAVAAAERAAARIGRWAPALLVALAAACALESRSYAAVFRDEDALWTYGVGRNPDAWPAHYNLATYLAHHGELPRAAEEFTATLRLRPDFAEAHFNLGNTLFLQRRLPEALGQYAEALRLQPGAADFHVGMGNALYLAGRAPEAAAQYEEALRLRPGDARIEANLAIARRAAPQ